MTDKYLCADIMYMRCAEKEEKAIAENNWPIFFKYHKIALRLIEYRLNLIKNNHIAKELQAKKDAEAKELESKRLAQLAPDKDKINALYKSIQTFTIPEFQSNEAKEIGKLVRAYLDKILVEIKTESQKLK